MGRWPPSMPLRPPFRPACWPRWPTTRWSVSSPPAATTRSPRWTRATGGGSCVSRRGSCPAGPADAEDVVQDAMVRAVRALRNGSRPDAVGAWLHRITRNCALDLTASRRRHPVVELADHAHPPAEDAQAAVERSLGVRGLVADVSAAARHAALGARPARARGPQLRRHRRPARHHRPGRQVAARARPPRAQARPRRPARRRVAAAAAAEPHRRARRLGLGAAGRQRHAQGRLRGRRRRRLAADGLGQDAGRRSPQPRAPRARGHAPPRRRRRRRPAPPTLTAPGRAAAGAPATARAPGSRARTLRRRRSPPS